MASTSVASLVNRKAMGKALAQARKVCANNRPWLNAVNRAALNLEACPWQFDGDTLRIASATEGGTFHRVDAHGCDCRAFQKGQPCWHRAAWRLLCKAAEVAYTARSTNGYQDAPLRPFEDAKPSFTELTAALNAELYA